ncbi:MAG TPA: hypothetical protein VLS89_16560, partial [Candidatus Nanopelagicales bacterium]|nr:hypothetical protein [Candidatus Nanopelagicales bacterium]
MTEPARRLRRADELQLRVVLAALRRGGRFVIVVADEETWPEVRGVLERDLTPPPLHEFRPFDGNDVIEIFSSSEADLEGVIILHVGSEATGAVEALNLHRDKLRQKRSQFILRLDGAAAHERFVRVAPDCYSFRDAVVIIETYPAIVPIQRDNERLEMLRREVAEAKVPGRLRRVARDLIALAQYEEARRALEKEIGLLGAGFWLSPEERLELAGIDYDLSLCTVDEERRRHVVDALRTLEPVRDLYHGEYAAFLRGLCDGYGTDPDAVREALTILQQAGAHRSRPMMATLTNLARALAARDDVKGAREVLAQISDPWWGSSYNNEFVAELSEFLVLIKEGRWEWCERRLRETLAASAQVKDEHWFTFYALALAHLLTMRAEFGAALDVL